MRVGFPVVVKTGKDVEIVKVFASEADDAGGTPRVICDGLGAEMTELSLDALPAALHGAVKSMLAKGKSLLLQFEARTNAAIGALVDKAGRVDIDGQSGTLALHLVSHFAEQLRHSPRPDHVLVSGRVYWKDDGHRVGDLKAPTDVKHKAAGTKEPLWLHRLDFDQLDPEMQGSGRVIPFDAQQDRMDWLLHEFAQTYELVKSPVAGTAAANLWAGNQLTERDLLRAAIHESFFGGNVENEDDTFEKALQKRFGKRPNRELLPVQQKALDEDKRHSIFFDPMHPERTLRHVVISGPTGCGKTTLLHSLVLNGLHNRTGGVMYIGPVKALVEEFHASISKDLSGLLPNEATQPVLLSTGDFSRDDSLITQGRFGAACLVNEKANVLFSSDEPRNLLRRLSLVIIDELHMLRDPSRGGVLDLLLTKVALEARRRRKEANYKPLQLVMVSTESLAKTVVNLSAYLSDPEDPESGPVLLDVAKRPLDVVHSVAVLAEGKSQFSLRKIVTFKGNENRTLSEPDRLALMKTLGPGRDDWSRWVSASSKRAYTDGQIQELVIQKRKEHKTLIVALPSVEATYSNASGLANKLTHPLDVHHIDKNFEREVHRSGLGALQERLVRWAGKGIYVHHSQLPRRLRTAIEAIFREPLKPNSRPKVLLTTETLTYGVNLSAGCVILSTLEWSRDDPTNPFQPPSPEEMDPNQYHNLLGRAGRLGLMAEGELAEAIVCVPVSKFLEPKDRTAFLTRYYAEPAIPERLFSAIAQPADLARFDYDRDSKTALPKGDHALTEYSFSVFRSTIDALRTAGSSAKASAALEVFRATLCCESAAARHDRGTLAKLEACFGTVLNKAADYAKGNIKLVNRTGDAYETTAAASALIDTGTSLISVEPMAIWLQKLQEREDFHLLTSEALLPALVVAPDFTKIACELTPGATSKDLFENQEDARRRLEQVKGLARTELDEIRAGELVRSIEEFLSMPEIINALRLVQVAERRAIVFWQLLTAVLRWLRGCSEEDVKEPLILFKTGEKRWLPKHADRLEQLAKMCYRFFSSGEGFLTNQQKLQLPQLALRLKHGIPFNATPYLNVFSMDGILPREAVVALYGAVNDPFRLLQGRGAELVKIQKVLDTTQTNASGTDDVLRVVRQAYEEYRHAFLNAIDRDSASEFAQKARDAFADEQQTFSNFWKPEPLLRAIVEHVQANEAGGEFHFTVQRAPAGDGFSMSAAGGPPQLAFGTDGVRFADGVRHVQVLAWHESPPEHWCITPCAFVLLMSLFLRRFVDFGTLLASMSGAPQRIDVYWIASNLWEAPGLQGMSGLREDLLAFVEPVQQLEAADDTRDGPFSRDEP